MATSRDFCVALRPSSVLYRTPSGPIMFHAQKVIVKAEQGQDQVPGLARLERRRHSAAVLVTVVRLRCQGVTAGRGRGCRPGAQPRCVGAAPGAGGSSRLR